MTSTIGARIGYKRISTLGLSMLNHETLFTWNKFTFNKSYVLFMEFYLYNEFIYYLIILPPVFHAEMLHYEVITDSLSF